MLSIRQCSYSFQANINLGMIIDYRKASKLSLIKPLNYIDLTSFLTLRKHERRPFVDALIALRSNILDTIQCVDEKFKLLMPIAYRLLREQRK